jgi:hypothetical protein
MNTSMRHVGMAARIGSLWYFAVPLVSVGLFTFLPFLHAAIRLRKLWVWLTAFVFAVLGTGFIYWSGLSTGAEPGAMDAVAIIALLGSLVGGMAVLARLRRQVYGLGELEQPASPPTTAAPEAESTVDPAVRQVLQARKKRAQARDLAARDPLMARELGMGRPDLAGDYDDGGLVDIATAPATVIAKVCELTPEHAAAVVAVRDTAITVEDLFSLTDLPVSTWDRVRDRAIIIR